MVTLATGSFDTTVILWDLTDPARPHHLGLPLSSNVALGAASIAEWERYVPDLPYQETCPA